VNMNMAAPTLFPPDWASLALDNQMDSFAPTPAMRAQYQQAFTDIMMIAIWV